MPLPFVPMNLDETLTTIINVPPIQVRFCFSLSTFRNFLFVWVYTVSDLLSFLNLWVYVYCQFWIFFISLDTFSNSALFPFSVDCDNTGVRFFVVVPQIAEGLCVILSLCYFSRLFSFCSNVIISVVLPSSYFFISSIALLSFLFKINQVFSYLFIEAISWWVI